MDLELPRNYHPQDDTIGGVGPDIMATDRWATVSSQNPTRPDPRKVRREPLLYDIGEDEVADDGNTGAIRHGGSSC